MKKYINHIKKSQYLNFDNVTIKIDNNIILKDITFSVDWNEKLFIIGSSGVGKTTLINSIIDNEIMSNGNIQLDKVILNDEKRKNKLKIIKSLGIISQRDYFIEWETVYYNIKNLYPKYKNSFYEFFNIINKKQKHDIFKLADYLKIKDLLFKKVSDISGGERQRIKILLLLLKKPNLILADEPTTSLDIKKSKAIIKSLCNIKNSAALINIHKLDLIPSGKYRVLAIKNKKIIFDGPKSKLTKKLIEDIYE